MRFHTLPTRWSVVPFSVVVIGLCTSLFAWQHDAAEKRDAGEEDLTEKVEVKLPPMLRGSGRNIYHVEAKVANTSKETILGPLLLVIQGTGLDGLRVKNADGKLDQGTPFFEIVPDGKELAPEKEAKPRKVLFTSAKRLSLRDRRRFKLDFRVIRRAAEHHRRRSGAKTEKVKRPSAEALRRVMQIQDRWTDRLLQKKGVVGTATGVDAKGRPVVMVFAEQARIAGIPKTVDGVLVKVQVTGRLFARQKFFAGPATEPPRSDSEPLPGVVSPTDRLNRPVPIGVSTGNSGRCSSGTIACRVRGSDGKRYALSNNHVYALQNNANIGDDILQPGRADTGCQIGPSDIIADLSAFVEIDLNGGVNRVDAAIAEIREDALGNATPEDGYGTPSSQTVSPTILQRVQKYGRTTALTEGFVIGVNATVNVRYSAGIARFVDQLVVMGTRSGFIKSGDSGSLLVTKDGNHPVGLLFAGSLGGRFGIANSIDDVLRELNVTIDGEGSGEFSKSTPTSG